MKKSIKNFNSKVFLSVMTMALLPISAHAELFYQNSMTSESFEKFLKKISSENKESSLEGDFAFQSNSLVDNVGEVVGNKHFGSFNLKYQSYSDTDVYKGLEFATRVNDEEVLQYSIKEAFIDLRYSNSRLGFGRSNLEWSQVDKIWGLGKVNNRVNFDYFEPDQEGLIGVFYDKQYSNGFNLGLFGSLVYVPEMSQGLVVDKESGAIECKTPWCDAPASSAEIEGKQVPIVYNVNYPDVSDVINKYSVGLKLGYKFTENIGADLFYLRKPENELSVTAEVSVPPEVSVINVDVTPQFFYHDVRGGNFEFKLTDEFAIYASAIGITPNKYPDGDEPFIEYTGIKPKKKFEEYGSGGFKYNDGDLKGHLGYIARLSEFDTENDILVNYPRWNQAVHLAISKNLTRKLFVALDLKYDMLTEDRLAMFNTSYSFGPNVVASLGVNTIGTSDSKESFWAKYENNDAAYTSLKYKF